MPAIARRDPRNLFAVPGLMGRLLNDPFFSSNLTNGTDLLPELDESALALDISEDEKNLIVRASLPGFKKEEIDIEVHDGVLTIKATHTEQAQAATETYLRRERRIRSLQRRVALPTTVEGAKVDAELKDGELTLRLAKTPEAQPRKIAIR
jgi:HSP20 family protein